AARSRCGAPSVSRLCGARCHDPRGIADPGAGARRMGDVQGSGGPRVASVVPVGLARRRPCAQRDGTRDRRGVRAVRRGRGGGPHLHAARGPLGADPRRGDMAELAATCLVSEGVRVTLVANRTYERARAIAEQLGARALTLDEAWEHFADADIVLSSTAAPHAVVTWDRVAPAVARRRGRPLCILDLGMPRDVEPSVAQLENVFLYD